MRACQATPALPHLNATGFDTCDLTGGTFFVVMLRESGEDPWAALDWLVKGCPMLATGPGCGRSRSAASASSPTRCSTTRSATTRRYGPLMRPVEPHVADRIFSQPRVKELEKWERDQTTVAEFREKLGKNLSDEELLLRYFCPQEQVEKMLAGPSLRTDPPAASPELGDQLTRLITEAQERPVSHLSLSRSGITIDRRRDANGSGE